MADYEDPAAEERWCAERRLQVEEYLKSEGVEHGRIGEWPAWHVAPYVSIWAIESKRAPGHVGWWAICGDLPTDCVSAETIKHPRDAMRSIAESWLEQTESMAQGKAVPGASIGASENRESLAPLLKSRASMLLKWANDDSLWEEDAL